MKITTQDWCPHSLASDWEAAMFTRFPYARTVGELLGLNTLPTMLNSSAQFQAMGVETAGAALQATRHLIDVWRMSIRDRQDAFLQGWADQVGRLLAESEASTAHRPMTPIAADIHAAPPAENDTSLTRAT